jgi:hypothetical protein
MGHLLFFRILGDTGMPPGELAGMPRTALIGRQIQITQSVWVANYKP